MARLLFIENREKTFFWAAIARILENNGHTVSWIVQNPIFARDLPGRVHRIPFPSAQELDASVDLAAFPALVTDRGRDLFGAGSAHYGYYAKRLASILAAETPDLVLGETTLFHELIVIDLCAARGIPFAHPVGERYPNDRFAIFDGPSQRSMIESGDRMDEAAAADLASRIGDGRTVPTYMNTGDATRLKRRAQWAAMRLRVLAGRLRGERYNTPSLARKLELNRLVKTNVARWRAAERLPTPGARTILYPLQMQPENTIDVWGRPDCDQVDIIRRILAATPDDVHVAVKANPKPFYELSTALLDLCVDHPRVVLLPFSMRMMEALEVTIGALTVTGTVGYEAVCGRGRCISTAHPILDDHFPMFTAPTIEAAAKRLLDDSAAGRGSTEEGVRLLQRLTARSFDGLISDPVSDPRCMAPANIAKIARGIGVAIAALDKSGAGAAGGAAPPAVNALGTAA